MIKFAANLSILFQEVPLLERFQKAVDAGFQVVEIWSPIETDPHALVKAKNEAGIELLQFNLDMGDLAAGDRGLLSIPDFTERFRSGFEMVMQLAKLYNVRQLNCLVGNKVENQTKEIQLLCMKDNLEWLHPQLEVNDLALNIEVLSSVQSPNYLLTGFGELFSIVKQLDLPRVGVQYDLFHAQLMEGNLVTTVRENLPLIGHIQIADVPDRHQPGTGEVNYRYVLAEIEAMGYKKFVSLEYEPLGSTDESLNWLPLESRVSATSNNLIF